MKLLTLTLLVACLPHVKNEEKEDAPSRAQTVARSFGDALKRGDVKAAREMVLPLVRPIAPDELDKNIARWSKQMSGDGAAWIVHEAREDGKVVVVVVEQRSSKEARADFDPLLLVERDGNLKLLIDDPEEHGIDGDELESCKKLLAWYKAEKEDRKQ